MGTVTKDGYRSDADSKGGVIIAAIIAGLAVVGAIMLVGALLSATGCGDGGGSDNAPIYDENGVCVNCNDNGDASVLQEDGYIYPSGDTCNGDTCSPHPQIDSVTGACEAIKAGKIPPEECRPKEAKEARCIFYDYKTDSNPDCDLSQTDHCWCSGGFYDQNDCSSQSPCQKITCEQWPPEVCWGLPCMLVGKWDCEGYMNLTDAEFYDNGDGYCRIHSPTAPNDDLYYKPGDDHVQRPPSGPPEEKYTLLGDGSQLKIDYGNNSVICPKMAEEE